MIGLRTVQFGSQYCINKTQNCKTLRGELPEICKVEISNSCCQYTHVYFRVNDTVDVVKPTSSCEFYKIDQFFSKSELDQGKALFKILLIIFY